MNPETRSRATGVVPGFPVPLLHGLDVPSWHLLPAVTPPARVLYLGAGGGDIAARLALSFGTLLVVEPSLGRARATRARSDALGVAQVHTVCGDVVRLPLQPDSLDLAVLDAGPDGTLCLARNSSDAPPLLASVSLGLKRGGVLCLRLAAGRTDEPMAEPRLGRLKLLLCLNRLRRLLRNFAYDDIRVWCAYPDCADPKFIAEWKQPVFDYFIRHLGNKPKSRSRAVAQRLFNAAGLLKYTAPGYFLLARRSEAMHG
jgi:SAM-dependent methyltransferase